MCDILPSPLKSFRIHCTCCCYFKWVHVTTCEEVGLKNTKPQLALLLMRDCAVLLFCETSGGCSRPLCPPASYSKAALLWQGWTGRAQRGLPLALDQADLGPDITSIAAASLLLALCCTLQLMMPCLSAAASSKMGRGDANLTEGWLTTSAAVAHCLMSMCFCFQCLPTLRDLTALLTSYLISQRDVFTTATQQVAIHCHVYH